jgi:hypothetical protein
MTKEEKEIQETKKNIVKRLSSSNPEIWESISEEQKNKAVEIYFHLFDVEEVGLRGAVDNIWQVRFGFYMTFLGCFMGVIGGIFGNVLTRYIPSGTVWDISILLSFILSFIFIYRDIEKLSIKDLRDHKILEHLIKSQNKNNEPPTEKKEL